MDIYAIAQQFENRTLPKEAWTHHAHLAVAFVAIEQKKSSDQALVWLRKNIQAYNISVGTPNTDQSGYHETLTVFWLTTVNAFYKQHANKLPAEVYQQFIQSKFAGTGFPAQFYSIEKLFSPTARKHWLPPDLKPIEDIPSMLIAPQ